jgi:SRSO17 transposase
VRANKWCKFERVLDDGSREVRYIREIIYGKKRALRYWEITTDIETLPENSTWYVMTQIPGVLAKEVGNLYGNRTWIEYGFRQSKSELGWAISESPNIHRLKNGGKSFVVLT